MADEAFALSPISARAAQLSEADYEAISDAFMETSRGRWFLGEYATRNRNADTRMVLDAVARIEQSLAAQQQPSDGHELAEALATLGSALDQARRAAAGALDGLALEENLAPIRKAARVIKEISWRWREIGGDGRICDLLDAQFSAIEGACGQLASVDPRQALSAAFDLVEQRIAGLDQHDGAVPRHADPAMNSAAAVVAPADAVEMTAEGASAAAEVAEIAAEADDADQEAVLEMIAFEMAAPDPFEYDDICGSDPDQARLAEPLPVEPVVPAQQAPVVPAPQQPAATPRSLRPAPERSVDRSPDRSPDQTLGSTLVASGIVRRPHTAASDPLAPIRRMSQAEKIALFS